jgi:hypothetical protein
MKLTSYIEIDTKAGQKVIFDYCCNVEITSGLNNLTDTAVVEVPRNITRDGKTLDDFVKRGDAIHINLGYDGNYTTHFSGYVARISNTNPIVMECENAMWLFKQVEVKAEKLEPFDVAAYLKKHLPVGIELVTKATPKPDRFVIKGATTLARVLEYVRDYFSIRMFIDDTKLYVTTPVLLANKENGFGVVKLKYGSADSNIAKVDIKVTKGEDVKVRVRAKAILDDNTTISVALPEKETEGELHEYYDYSSKTKEQLTVFAEGKIAELKCDKADGEVTLLGLPTVKKGQVAHTWDTGRRELNDKMWLCEQVRTVFGHAAGFKQYVKLGRAIN